jgi:hypothetical protein
MWEIIFFCEVHILGTSGDAALIIIIIIIIAAWYISYLQTKFGTYAKVVCCLSSTKVEIKDGGAVHDINNLTRS